MSNLQIIEALCNVAEQLTALVKRLTGKLEQVNALDEADREAVDKATGLYAATIGAGEVPDELYQEDREHGEDESK